MKVLLVTVNSKGLLNKIKIYGISIPICLVFVSLLIINSSYAQSSENFKTYSNNDLNFSIQHPSNWKAEQSDLDGDGPSEGVYFKIRENPEDKIKFGDDLSITPNSYFRVDVKKIESQLDYNTMTLQNKSLEQYVQGTLDVMPLNSETLIRQNQVTVGGNDGIKIEYTDNENDKDYYGFNILTIADGKLYNLRYEEKPLKVPETLPLVNQMVESFQVNTEDEDKRKDTFPDDEDTSNYSTFEDFQNKYCPPMSLVLCYTPDEEPQVPPPPPD